VVHSVFGFQMADDRLDGGATAQLAFDLLGDVLPLTGDEDPELVGLWGILAAITASAMTRLIVAPICFSVSGKTTPSVWPS
jgi:hypothetical protein